MAPMHSPPGGGPPLLHAAPPPLAPHTINYYLPKIKIGMGLAYFAVGAVAMQINPHGMGLWFMVIGAGLVYLPPYF